MGDSFVDVSYRGLEVGRRLRIREFTADAAYVEAPTPMPVGSALEIVTDAGAKIVAVVARVHEQIGGSDRPPGMKVKATLDGDARAWWDRMIAESPAPVEAPPPPRPVSAPVPVPVVSERTAPASPESGPVVVDDGQRTQVMPVIDPAELERDDDGGNGEIVDDGKRTQMMSTVEIEAIVAQANAAPSGPTSRAGTDSDDSGDLEIEVTGGDGDEDVSQDGPSNGNGASSSKKKRRRKKKK